MDDPYNLRGTILGDRYHLEDFAGEGGMGIVYRGRDTSSDAVIAVKVLHPLLPLSQRDHYLRLFAREVEAAQSLVHPNILSILDSGFDRDVAFIVMEWLKGRTLAQELKMGKFALRRAAVVLEQVCDALNYAHRRQTIHMDIKPSNIFLLDTEGGGDIVKIIDFGLARIMQSSVGTTLSHYRGTKPYSAPEVFQDQASHLSDIYSLGVMAFEILSGRRPFNGSAEAVMYQHLFEPPPSLRRSLPEIPELVDDLIRRAMSKRPRLRHGTAIVFGDEFLKAVRRSERAKKLGSSYETDRSALRLPTISLPTISLPTIRAPKRATRPRRLKLGQPRPLNGQRGNYLAGVFLSALRDFATWADRVIARRRYQLTRYYLNHRLRDLRIVLVLSLLIMVYPFPKLIGLPIGRFHGALMFGTAFFLIGLDPRKLPTARLFMQRLTLSIWLVSWSIVVTPSKLLGSNLSRVGSWGCWLSSFGCLCWTHKIKVRNDRNEVVEIRPLKARIVGTIAIILGVVFGLYAWLR